MSANAIFYDKTEGRFHFDSGYSLSPTQVGRKIVTALLNGTEDTAISVDKWGRAITVNYLLQMLRHTGQTGRFFDCLDRTADHDFDPNSPTPGGVWGYAARLRAEARTMDAMAEELDCLYSVSRAQAQLANELRREAALFNDTRTYPLVNAMTLPQADLWDSRVGADAIWFAPESNTFKFGGYKIGASKLARLIAFSLLKGEEWVVVGEIEVTVNYLVQMAREVGRNGEFVDLTDEEFDPNVAPDMSVDA